MSEYVGNAREIINWLLSQDKDETFVIKTRKKRRSLTQNAYYWVLNDKLASALRMGRDELHRQLIRRYAPCEVVTVLKNVPVDDYFRYADVFGSGTLNGRDYNHVRIYKGSSQMNSAEFARLLDGVRDECEHQGIQTLTPSEIAQLDYIEPKGAVGH